MTGVQTCALPISVVEYELMFLSFLSFCIFLLSKTKVLRGLSYVLLLFLSLNFMLSASCFFIYKQGFNVGMTISILETNVSESLSMVRTLIYPISASLVFYIILLMLFRSGAKDKGNLLRRRAHPWHRPRHRPQPQLRLRLPTDTRFRSLSELPRTLSRPPH